MTDAAKLSDLQFPDLQGDGSRQSKTRRHHRGPHQTRAVRAQLSAPAPREIGAQRYRIHFPPLRRQACSRANSIASIDRLQR